MLHQRRFMWWSRVGKLALLVLIPLQLATQTATAASACATSAVHTVQSGETLSGIARQYGVTEAAIAQANGLTNPHMIYAGRRLVTPLCSRVPVLSTASGTAQTIHTVQSGETLSGIARQYGVTEATIAQANGLANPHAIYAGHRLAIPSVRNTPSVVPPVAANVPAPVVAPPRAATAAAPAVVPPRAANAAAPAVALPSTAKPSGATRVTIPSGAHGPKRIEVNLRTQWLYAYEGYQLVLSSGISTGRSGWETPTGNFKIYAKNPMQTLSGSVNGEAWYVPDVPHVMYIYLGIAFHGAYWHDAFGTGQRLSNGCINQPLDVAAQLYTWAPIGTPVWIHD